MYGIIRSGMSTAMHEIAVVSNNIANSGSTGFKQRDVSFHDIYGSATPDPEARTPARFGRARAGPRRTHGAGAGGAGAGRGHHGLMGTGRRRGSP